TLNFPGAGAQLQMRDASAFMEFVQLCFAQKRKTLVNNLRPKFAKKKPSRKSASNIGPGFDLAEVLRDAGVSVTARAEELTIAQLAGLFRKLA
nr:hypothetical protein [Candidatus Acidoferrales bacterium]